jgi:cytochrome c-type biogenesis protein CcmH/NrfF
MHRDVMALVEGGYGAQEIIDAFQGVYGERVLMAPNKSGFNLVGWMAPGVAILLGGTALTVLLRRWDARGEAHRPATPLPIDATPDELARVEAAVRGRDDT